MKKKSANIIFVIVAILAIVFVIGFYIYDVVWVKTPVTKNLFRTIAVVFLLIGAVIRLVNGTHRSSLNMYEKAYEKELGAAFKNKPMSRKRLLCAVRFYNESNYKKAMKNLFPLLNKAELARDLVPVLFFIALCYTDGGAPEEAIKVYYDLLRYDPNNSTAHSNLSQLYTRRGNYDMALQHCDKAIECDPNNEVAYNNRANYYFRTDNYEAAIADAKKALEIKNNMIQAASLLAIIYALRGDAENKKKYYHIAITSGQNPESLDRAIEHYMSELDEPDDYDEEEKLNEGE